MKLLLDAGPYLINKTAMSRIVVDTLHALSNEDIRTRALYFSRPGIALSGWHVKTARKLFGLSLRLPIPFLLLQQLVKDVIYPFRRPLKQGQETVLYFDPIYTLFHNDLDRAVVFVLDLTPITFPSWHSRSAVWFYRMAFKQLAASRCHILSISTSTTNDLRINFGIHPSRITTLPLYGPEFKTRLASPRTNVAQLSHKKYLLFVGSLETRKNILGLIEAFSISDLAADGYMLVIAGGAGHGASVIKRAADYTAGVKLLGYVNDAELDSLYQNAAGFAYPSLWEGFGVPLLEAMARGLPCLSTITGASPEIGGSAVIYVDPCDIRSIAQGLRKLVQMPDPERAERIAKGRQLAQQYTFTNYIDGLRKVLARVHAHDR